MTGYLIALQGFEEPFYISLKRQVGKPQADKAVRGLLKTYAEGFKIGYNLALGVGQEHLAATLNAQEVEIKLGLDFKEKPKDFGFAIGFLAACFLENSIRRVLDYKKIIAVLKYINHDDQHYNQLLTLKAKSEARK